MQSFITPIPDNKIKNVHPEIIKQWRNRATELDYTGSIAFKVKAGFSFKTHGPQSGLCYENWKYLQDWKLKNNEPTKNEVVFWIPRIIPESLKKTTSEQKKLTSTFGSVSLLTALILNYYQRTKEKVPLNGYYVRTDTLHVDGARLCLDWFGGELYCGGWFDDGRFGNLGAFPLGLGSDSDLDTQGLGTSEIGLLERVKKLEQFQERVENYLKL